MKTIEFNWKDYSECADTAEFYAQPEYKAMQEFISTSGMVSGYGSTIDYHRAVLTNVRYEQRDMAVKHIHRSNGYTFEIENVWVAVDNTNDKVITGATRLSWKHDSEAKARKAVAKWLKTMQQAQIEHDFMRAADQATRELSTWSRDRVAALPVPHTNTQVNDVVKVHGFGKDRAGLVMEVTPKRVKCVIRTVESTKRDGDYGYVKWFTI